MGFGEKKKELGGVCFLSAVFTHRPCFMHSFFLLFFPSGWDLGWKGRGGGISSKGSDICIFFFVREEEQKSSFLTVVQICRIVRFDCEQRNCS